jgi:hypothetical protein
VLAVGNCYLRKPEQDPALEQNYESPFELKIRTSSMWIMRGAGRAIATTLRSLTNARSSIRCIGPFLTHSSGMSMSFQLRLELVLRHVAPHR